MPKNKGKNAVPKKISKKYKKIRQKKGKTKELTKKTTSGNMRKSKHLWTDGMEMVKYNSDIEVDNLSTLNYNSELDDTSDVETIDYNTKTKKNSIA